MCLKVIETVCYTLASVIEAVVHFKVVVILEILMVSNNRIHGEIQLQCTQSQRGSGSFRGRGRSSRGRGASWQSSGQSNRDKDCQSCGVYGHTEKDCYKKQRDSNGRQQRGRQHGHYASSSGTHDEQDNSRLFAMQHVSNHASKEQIDERWYID